MAGKQPFFLTGANAKLKVNGKTLAFATNVNYRIQVVHEDPRVLGMYEGHSLEPVSYKVSGSFTVIRYVAPSDGAAGVAVSGTKPTGNGAGAWGSNKLGDALGSRPSPREFFNPRLFDRQSSITIEVIQKMPNGESTAARIKGAKLTLADFNISDKKSAARQTFQFEALYVDEDSFLAAFSGQGQQYN